MVENLPIPVETQVVSLGHEDPLEKEWLPILEFLTGEFRELDMSWAQLGQPTLSLLPFNFFIPALCFFREEVKRSRFQQTSA